MEVTEEILEEIVEEFKEQEDELYEVTMCDYDDEAVDVYRKEPKGVNGSSGGLGSLPFTVLEKFGFTFINEVFSDDEGRVHAIVSYIENE